MSRLSISRAWDETKSVLGRDGRLLATVALALVALPSAISTLVSPDSRMSGTDGPLLPAIVVIVMSIVAMVGQLAIIRLAIGPSVSVGGAIGHAMRRAPAYLGSILILVVGLVIVAVPIGIALGLSGGSLDEGAPASSGALLGLLLITAILIFVAARMLMSSSVASAEAVGPLAIIKRSWQLTSGNTGRLLGFLLLFLIAAMIVLIAIGTMAALLARVLFGDIEPWSAAALLTGLIQGIASAAATTIFAVMLARIYVQLSGGDAEVTVPTSGT